MQDGPVGFVELPVGDEAKVEPGLGAGVILLGTCQKFMPVEKSIRIRVQIPKAEVDSAKVAVHLGQVIATEGGVPVAIVLPHFSRGRITIFIAIHEYFEIISFAGRHEEREISITRLEDLFRGQASVGLQSPNVSRPRHHAVVGYPAAHARQLRIAGIVSRGISVRGVQGEVIRVPGPQVPTRAHIRGVQGELVRIPEPEVSPRSRVRGVQGELVRIPEPEVSARSRVRGVQGELVRISEPEVSARARIRGVEGELVRIPITGHVALRLQPNDREKQGKQKREQGPAAGPWAQGRFLKASDQGSGPMLVC